MMKKKEMMKKRKKLITKFNIISYNFEFFYYLKYSYMYSFT